MKTKYIAAFLLCIFSLSVGHAQTKSYKRGISYSIPSAGDVVSLSDGLTWYYNWAHLPAEDPDILNAMEEYGLDFIPMVWNGNIEKDKLRSFYAKNPQVKYILGFNEPNFLEQARMTPTEAAARWGDIEEIADEFGLKIVSPAVNYAPSNGAVSENGVVYVDPYKWLDDFFAACPDCRVDYIAAHCYMSTVGSLTSYINGFKKYGKPIWLTEFCAWDNAVTDIWQRNYLADAVNYLEQEPDVYRYAWFIGRYKGTGTYPYMQLLGRYEGQLTEKGKVYVNMSSFDDDFYHQVNDTIPGEQYVQVSSGVHFQESTDETGILNLCDFLVTRWTVYNLDVPEAGEYTIYARVATQYETQLKYSVDGTDLMTQDIAITGGLDQWKTIETKVQLQAGKQKLRVDITKGRVNFNWLKVDNGSSGIGENESDFVRVYPNPTKDILYINSAFDAKATLTDLTGKVLFKETSAQEINMTAFPQGIYLLSLELSDGRKTVEKIVKTN